MVNFTHIEGGNAVLAQIVEDFVQIITVFSCKLQGKRANKARNLVKELIEDGEENNDKNNASNVTAKQ